MPDYHKRVRARNALHNEVQNILDQKTERRTKDGHDKEAEGERDLLDILMDCQNEEGAMLTRDELCAQTKTFLLAGFETSSTCILWTMYILAKRTDIQEKLAEEIISVIGTDRKPTAEDIDKMPYLYKVLRESLRYCPPIPVVTRHTAEDVTLGGYFIPKDTFVVININHQHHNSSVWVKPEKFDPERWTSDESDTNSLLGTYLPFIMGARNCIGSRFAMLEVRVMLAMILQKLKFERVPGVPEVTPRARVAMVPSSPIHLLMSPRR
jgi:cytochrome P450